MAAVEGRRHSGGPRRLHHAAQGVGRRRRGQQQHLVVDERVAVQGDLVGSGRIAKRVQVALAVGVVEANGCRLCDR